jgi:hypothetical protein
MPYRVYGVSQERRTSPEHSNRCIGRPLQTTAHLGYRLRDNASGTPQRRKDQNGRGNRVADDSGAIGFGHHSKPNLTIGWITHEARTWPRVTPAARVFGRTADVAAVHQSDANNDRGQSEQLRTANMLTPRMTIASAMRKPARCC